MEGLLSGFMAEAAAGWAINGDHSDLDPTPVVRKALGILPIAFEPQPENLDTRPSASGAD
jgi:hypothetical protein